MHVRWSKSILPHSTEFRSVGLPAGAGFRRPRSAEASCRDGGAWGGRGGLALLALLHDTCKCQPEILLLVIHTLHVLIGTHHHHHLSEDVCESLKYSDGQEEGREGVGGMEAC